MPPTSGDADALVDTSVAVALVTADHPQHADVLDALRGRALGLAGHAAFETYSVLTRLPGLLRRSPPAAARLIAANFPRTVHLGVGAARELLADLGGRGVAGGSVYDALIGAVAVEHGLPLVTRDRRAAATYHALDVDLEVLA